MDISALSPREQRRFTRTLEVIPADVRNGLEIGFYELMLTRYLSQRLDLVSVDIPHPVKARDGHKLVFASIERLPFSAAAFDIVVCTEVLEHLPDELLARGASELARVAGRYILVTVPYRQEIGAELYKCAGCGHVCNAQGHVQIFDEARLLGLFPGARVLRSELIESVPSAGPVWLYKLANRLGNSWHPLVFGDTCPGCGKRASVPRPNLLGELLRRVLWRIEAHVKPRAAWILAVLEIRPETRGA